MDLPFGRGTRQKSWTATALQNARPGLLLDMFPGFISEVRGLLDQSRWIGKDPTFWCSAERMKGWDVVGQMQEMDHV